MKKIDALRKELFEKQQAAAHVEQQIDAIKEKEILPQYKEKFIGRYFVFRNSNGSQSWNLYRKVTGIKDVFYHGKFLSVTAELFEFEDYKNEYYPEGHSFSVSRQSTFPISDIGREITKQEFYAAWDDMLKRIRAMKQ